jgi:hypothetical protein
MGIAQEMKSLIEAYKDMSIECMQGLCEKAGVQYRHPSEAKQLVEDMHHNGFRIHVSKFTSPDISVGQFIVLTDFDLNVVFGYRIYIDFEGYCVRKVNITENEEVPFIQEKSGGVH